MPDGQGCSGSRATCLCGVLVRRLASIRPTIAGKNLTPKTEGSPIGSLDRGTISAIGARGCAKSLPITSKTELGSPNVFVGLIKYRS
jgi:hypothetical protein